MRSSTKTQIQVIAFKTIFAVITFMLALFIFFKLTRLIFFKGKEAFDHAVFDFLSQRLTPDLIDIMRFFTIFGKPEFLIPAYLILIGWFALKKEKTYAWEIFIMGSSSTVLLFGLKKLFGRERPENPVIEHLSGYSFPSGHALLTFVFCSVIIYLIWQSRLVQSWKWFFSFLLIIFSLIVGISRIILRVHYPSDVIAGFALGYAWVLLGLWIQHKYITHKNINQTFK